MYFFISSTSQSAKEINMKYMNSFCTQNCIKGIIDGKLQCNCGEDIGIYNWTWSKTNCSTNTRISNNSKDILFHPLYSSGTAAVRGDIPFQSNFHYYWEIKMISNLYGTDVMVGVGTSKIMLSDWKFRFCSMLGIDSQSWGYSYHGNIQHNNLVRRYGSQFGLGSIVGVHLDMCNGTLEFYVNRKPFGIAFKGLKGRELYPMVSSTAAQSAVRIICAVSEEPTLQMLCLEYISKSPVLYQKYREIPGLRRMYERKYFWIVPTDEEDEKKRLAELEDNLMCPLSYKNFLKRSKKLRVRWMPPEVHVHDGDAVPSDSDLDLKTSVDESSIPTASQEDSTSSSSSSSNAQGSPVEDVPSTSKQGCDESRIKIRRTDSCTSHSHCSLHDNKKLCAKCKFRMQIEDENMSDSSGS